MRIVVYVLALAIGCAAPLFVVTHAHAKDKPVSLTKTCRYGSFSNCLEANRRAGMEARGAANWCSRQGC